MKKIQTIPLAALLFFCFCFAQCHKDKTPAPDNPYGLPNATQTGANTFACLINGKKFIAYYNPSNGTGAKVINDTLGVTGQLKAINYFEFIGFSIKGKLSQDLVYTIDSKSMYAILGTDSTCSGISFNTTTSYATRGNIQLKRFDPISRIVSGTFNFVFPIPNCDTLYITDGRFDYQYY
ncbi:MAG: hypothetical protein JSS98_05835 [Bacteroidetes bacterium]|nr:hypothetical protein [Bacteroidota bacterium]